MVEAFFKQTIYQGVGTAQMKNGRFNGHGEMVEHTALSAIAP
jgi:hypothetical protein